MTGSNEPLDGSKPFRMDIWPQLMRKSSTGAVPMLNNRLMITKCIQNGEANVWPGAFRVTRPR